MSELDEIARRNQQFWNKAVAERGGYTRPWLDLKKEMVRTFAEGKIEVLPEPYTYIYPQRAFRDVAGKEVLCLASGGGQQSAVFGLLGARVTVMDLTEGQLEGDRKVAEHHGYKITTLKGDMRDLSVFESESFDIVYQAISIVFVPDVRQVYREVARVLRAGGLYRIGYSNPAVQLVEEKSWDGKGYFIPSPYEGGRIEDEEEISVEFRHLLSDIFNGLIELGFIIKGVWEDPRHIHHNTKVEPGSYAHMLTYVQHHFAILAQKSKEDKTT
jgi:2-polyprenyl-3-methyl-5-hydroxy-6-metoxy-1,4-benzoquinol methylase